MSSLNQMEGASPLCDACPLHTAGSPNGLERAGRLFARGFKTAHRLVPANGDLLQAGDRFRVVGAIFTGWAYRYKSLGDGRRQIMNILLPGDMFALDAFLFGQVPVLPIDIFGARKASGHGHLVFRIEGSSGTARWRSRHRRQSTGKGDASSLGDQAVHRRERAWGRSVLRPPRRELSVRALVETGGPEA
jgi:CRP-like cAMP-binding protein